MYFYIVTYSFDSDRPIVGPFRNNDDCWNAMKKDAENEYRIDTEENEWDTAPLELSENDGIINLKNFFYDHEDITTWSIIDVPCGFSEEQAKAVINLLIESNVNIIRADYIVSKINEIICGTYK